MSGTNWIVIVGVVLLLIIGIWYFTSSGTDTDDGAVATQPAAEAPAEAPAAN